MEVPHAVTDGGSVDETPGTAKNAGAVPALLAYSDTPFDRLRGSSAALFVKPVEVTVKTEGVNAVQVRLCGTEFKDHVRTIELRAGVGEVPVASVELVAREGFDATLDANVYVSIEVPRGCTLEVEDVDGRLRYRAISEAEQ